MLRACTKSCARPWPQAGRDAPGRRWVLSSHCSLGQATRPGRRPKLALVQACVAQLGVEILNDRGRLKPARREAVPFHAALLPRRGTVASPEPSSRAFRTIASCRGMPSYWSDSPMKTLSSVAGVVVLGMVMSPEAGSGAAPCGGLPRLPQARSRPREVDRQRQASTAPPRSGGHSRG